MYKIKQEPEDFIVKEINNIEVKDSGEYLYFLLKKKNYNTLNAVSRIANALHVPINRFGYAGNKDKKAITEQIVSIYGVNKENLARVNLKDIEIKVLGYGMEYISIGDLVGNEFIITVRELNEEGIINFNEGIKNKPILMPNYFGVQRFSTQNIDVGRALIKREFEKAAELLKLDIIENDFIGAIRRVNKKIIRLYIRAYQSYIFNETVKEYLKNDIKDNEKIPIIGFGTELEEYNEKIAHIVKNILMDEKIDVRDFITVKMPELSEEGSIRDLFVEIKDLEVKEKKEDFVKIKFFLQKGSYATEAIDFLFG
ncbi:tRNA pseudouridine(13) synthase TruD [Candidatus Pacearchaeota archaeon]|nr:tRNA pseudouridine(13) synthase TruD [Candidatus Pacearchaeota archaeon]